MDEPIRRLLDVQDKDERIANLQIMILSVPAEKEKIANELQGAEDQLADSKSKLQKTQSKINDLESDIQAAKARITQLNMKSAEVKKNDEYRAILGQIEKIKEQISGFEDQQLELMDGVEDAQGTFEQDQKIKNAADARIKAAQADLDIRAKNCEAQVAILKDQRAKLVADVPVDTYRLYERLVARQKPGALFRKGIVSIIDNCCGSCHLTVPADLRLKAQAANGLTTCGSCGAILFYE